MSGVRRRQFTDTETASSHSMDEPVDIKGDRCNIVVLCSLYLLQGIPLGLTSAIPLILQNHGASFKQQAEFSFVYWPFSLKLLWAPLVDSFYQPRFGRRKTWLVPAQYLIGFFMIFLSVHVEDFLGNKEKNQEPHIAVLTALFFMLNFLAATQDIAVDGWALTMLQRRNVSYASTCNSVGQTAGYFLGYVVFTALESAEFCNNYIRLEPEPNGFLTLPGFLFFWGIVYIFVTTLVAFLKHEKQDCVVISNPEPLKVALDSYRQLLNILKLSPIQTFVCVLLTVKMGFAACDAVTSLKLMEGGVPKEKLAILAVPLVPLQIIWPIVISRYATSRRPMDMYIKVIPYRLMFGVIAAFFVYITPLILTNNDIPTMYFIMLLILLAMHQITLNTMFVQSMAFFARVSDPNVGGTYMTLLNTLSNLGGTWTSTVALWLVDSLTWKSCSNDPLNNCSTSELSQGCVANSGSCEPWFDGYYLETALCTLVGIIWFSWGKRVVDNLQSRPLNDWKISRR